MDDSDMNNNHNDANMDGDMDGDDDGLDIFQQFLVAVGDVDVPLVEAAEQSEEVMELLQHVCLNILQARMHIRGEQEAFDEQVLQVYIPILQHVMERKDINDYEGQMPEGVSLFTVLQCIRHVSTVAAEDSPILAPVVHELQQQAEEQSQEQQSNGHNHHPSTLHASQSDLTSQTLEDQPTERLVKDLHMIVHARQCTQDACPLGYCENMKGFLQQADEVTWEEAQEKCGDTLYCKQLENHFDKCKKPSCVVCSIIINALNNEKKGKVSRKMGSGARARASRSVSMPPRPDLQTQLQMQQQHLMPTQQYSMFPSPQFFVVPNMYTTYAMGPPMMSFQYQQQPQQAFPMMAAQRDAHISQEEQQQQMHDEEVMEQQMKGTRLKAHSTPIKPNLDVMQEVEDE